MGTHMELDTETMLSVSNDMYDNVTEVVETDPSHTIDSVFLNLNTERYELNAFPIGSDHRLKRGTIHSIELHNFKSYFGTVIVNKLSSFNAIIGPNGSGKSNLMDAISFVLCIRTSTLRGSNLGDLINKNPDKNDPLESRYAYVALTLKGDTGFSVFKRVINSKGNISYIYNNNVITFKGYTEALHEYKINTLGSTGLIFQGSVNDIISRSPLELTRLFENISGSSLYEKPYNYIKEKLELVRSDYKNMLSRKKQLNNELKQFRTMESTNRKYQQQLEEYNQIQMDSYTCQFTILANKFHYSTSRYKKLMSDYKDLVQKFEKSTKTKNELEERIANLYYNQGKINRTIQHKTQSLNEMRNSMTEFFGKKASLEAQIDNMETMRMNANNDYVSLEKQYDDIKRSRDELTAEIDEIIKDLDSSKDSSVTLTKAQMDEFNKSLREFKNLTCSININVNLLKTSISQYKTENKQVGNKLKALESQMEQVSENLRKHNQLIDSMESKMVEYRDSLETLQITLNKLENTKSELMENKEDMVSKRGLYDEKIKALGVLKHEHNYMFKRSLANNEMSKNIKGVHGEVMSLFEMSNNSYLKPVMSALGSRVHTIVADDYKTITKCIQFLKEKKAGRREFLSLTSLNYDRTATRRSISNYLKKVEGLDYVFVIDSIDFYPKFKPLFEYLVGDAVIVPTLDDAEKIVTVNSREKSSSEKMAIKNKNDNSLCFNVVTHNGQLITRDRTIVIGSTITANNSEIELEIAHFNKYVNLLNEVEKQLTLASNKEKTINDEIQNNTTKLDKYKRMIQLTTMKVDFLKKQRESVKLQQNDISQEISKVTKQYKSLERSIQTLNSDLTKENSKLEKIKKEHFGPLNKKFKVDDVYKLFKTRDEKMDSLNISLNEKRNTLSRYEVDLKELEIKMDTTRRKILELKEQLVSHKSELDQLKGANVNICDKMEGLQEEISTHRESLQEYVNQIEDCNAEMKNIRPEDENYGPDGRVNVMEQITTLKTEIKRLYMEAIGLAETCKVKNIPLDIRVPNNSIYPSGAADSSKEGSGDTNRSRSTNESDVGTNANDGGNIKRRRGSIRASSDKIDDIDYDNLKFPALLGPTGGNLESTSVLGYTLDAPPGSDFGSSESHHSTISSLEKKNEMYQEQLKKLHKSLGASRSYNNVENRVETTAEELKTVERELDATRNQLVKLESDFENIKRERSGLFLHCFNSVRENVGPIYSKLSSVEGAEGQAFLSLDDVATLDPEPFNCSIRYNTMPPMKKYLDLNLQSGGEKALSSIALLLALHNYRESPFVVLDEIDANIDSVKLKNLTNFLRESAFQVIIISLKEKLFSNAQRLIGVYRSHPSFTSKCLVLNLEEYEHEVD